MYYGIGAPQWKKWSSNLLTHIPGGCLLLGGGVCSRGERLLHVGVSAPGGVPGGDPPGTATDAGGTHPTGMHSCCKWCIYIVMVRLLCSKGMWMMLVSMFKKLVRQLSLLWFHWTSNGLVTLHWKGTKITVNCRNVDSGPRQASFS